RRRCWRASWRARASWPASATRAWSPSTTSTSRRARWRWSGSPAARCGRAWPRTPTGSRATRWRPRRAISSPRWRFCTGGGSSTAISSLRTSFCAAPPKWCWPTSAPLCGSTVRPVRSGSARGAGRRSTSRPSSSGARAPRRRPISTPPARSSGSSPPAARSGATPSCSSAAPRWSPPPRPHCRPRGARASTPASPRRPSSLWLFLIRAHRHVGLRPGPHRLIDIELDPGDDVRHRAEGGEADDFVELHEQRCRLGRLVVKAEDPTPEDRAGDDGVLEVREAAHGVAGVGIADETEVAEARQRPSVKSELRLLGIEEQLGHDADRAVVGELRVLGVWQRVLQPAHHRYRDVGGEGVTDFGLQLADPGPGEPRREVSLQTVELFVDRAIDRLEPVPLGVAVPGADAEPDPPLALAVARVEPFELFIAAAEPDVVALLPLFTLLERVLFFVADLGLGGLAGGLFLDHQDDVRAVGAAVGDDRLVRAVAPLEVELDRLPVDRLLGDLGLEPPLGRLGHQDLVVVLFPGRPVHEVDAGHRQARIQRATERERLVDDRLVRLGAVERPDVRRQIRLFVAVPVPFLPGVVLRRVRGLAPLQEGAAPLLLGGGGRVLVAATAARRATGRGAGTGVALRLGEGRRDLGALDPLGELDRGVDLQRAAEALHPLLAVVEAGDVDRAQVDVGAPHHRVIVEPGL